MNPTFTIFSGLYNSSEIIHRLFDSIKNQTFRDFEWIVFDDHSQDNTIVLVEQFIKENPVLSVTFIKHPTNKGIGYSYIEAMRIAKGKYLVQWDHDDIQKPYQLEVFNKTWTEYGNDTIASVWALCEDQNGNRLGNKFPKQVTVASYFAYYKKYISRYGRNGKFNERLPCIKISEYRKLKVLIDNKFSGKLEIPLPGFRWPTLAMFGYDFVFVNEILRVYYVEDFRDSLSKQRGVKTSEKISSSFEIWINVFFKYYKFQDASIKFHFLKSYVFHKINAGLSSKEILKEINSNYNKAFIFLMYYPIFTFWKIQSIRNSKK